MQSDQGGFSTCGAGKLPLSPAKGQGGRRQWVWCGGGMLEIETLFRALSSKILVQRVMLPPLHCVRKEKPFSKVFLDCGLEFVTQDPFFFFFLLLCPLF